MCSKSKKLFYAIYWICEFFATKFLIHPIPKAILTCHALLSTGFVAQIFGNKTSKLEKKKLSLTAV
jgi:hypothetical protein